MCKYYEQELYKKNILIQELDTTLKQKEIVLDSVKAILTKTDKVYVPKFERNSKFGEIYEYMKTKVKAPEATFALAVHETGGFTSNLSQNANNLFGFIYSPMSDFKYWSKGDGHYKSGWYD